MNVQIITPEKMVFTGQADGITLPTVTGELTILPGHVALVTPLRSGEIALHHGSERQHMAIHGGFVSVDGETVKLLTDAAELEEEVDERRASEALERAKQLRETAVDATVSAEALGAIERALTRLRLADRAKQRHRA
ncbi:ATP synthase F1 subunit epsilon [Candidatus Berkelbacteria bacterium]|nr:ATP synthase F1 subunit epsilon [Candidatus Berkelbacteria bacterium]